jgi:hypothetical protein
VTKRSTGNLRPNFSALNERKCSPLVHEHELIKVDA